MVKQVILACFELVVARFKPPTFPKCLEHWLLLDKKWVKNVFSQKDPRPFGVRKQVA